MQFENFFYSPFEIFSKNLNLNFAWCGSVSERLLIFADVSKKLAPSDWSEKHDVAKCEIDQSASDKHHDEIN